MTDWAHFEHGADIGIRGRGRTPAEAFAAAARALTAVVTDPDAVQVCEWVDIRCEAPDLDYLFLDWINALIYDMATSQRLFSAFEVDIQDNRLNGRAGGEPVDPARHHPAVEIKGATFTELKVTQEDDGTWIAQCVVDV
ncbi:archease [Thiohalobacter sp.]|uniref:archease n=1 Tax=Thiohalobacter sp. TaxID=2025948 RepID=UPI00260978B1|nr:archease [Thiohalobacter sp.]